MDQPTAEVSKTAKVGPAQLPKPVVESVEQQAANQRGFPPVGDRPFDQELERMRGEVERENHADGGLPVRTLALE